MKVLITGAAGFIGFHLSKYYLERGHKVLGIDNFITGQERNIEDLKKNQNFSFLKADVSGLDFSSLGNFDLAFHLASPASPPKYLKYPLETIKANVWGLYNLLQAAKEGKFKKVIFASTSEIYGDPLQHPQKETYWGNVNSFGPRACYDESKRLGETLSYVFIHKYKVDVRIARIFNTYGPRMQEDDGRVVSSFIVSALKGDPLLVHGDGSQTRSFCYVDDLVLGLVRLSENEKAKGEVFNLGNPEEKTILDFAKLIISLTKSKSEIKFVERPQDDPQKRRPDISKAKQFLGWSPKISLEEGLKKTIEYFRKVL